MYFKILQEDMKSHYGDFQYKLGLNVDTNPLNKSKMCSEGLHFCNGDNISRFFEYGTIIAEVEPAGDVRQIIIGKRECKAHSIIIKNVRPLWEIDTFKWLMDNGADISYIVTKYNELYDTVSYCIKNKYNDIALYLLNNIKSFGFNYRENMSFLLSSYNVDTSLFNTLIDKNPHISEDTFEKAINNFICRNDVYKFKKLLDYYVISSKLHSIDFNKIFNKAGDYKRKEMVEYLIKNKDKFHILKSRYYYKLTKKDTLAPGINTNTNNLYV